jgi:tetratricopeptide (TPR) repeat protein
MTTAGAAREAPVATTNRRAWLQGLAIVALALLVYVPATRSGFIWDDDAFLTANPLIRAPDGLHRIWATTEPPDYFPLTSTMLWVEWRVWGENAAGYHVISVVLHALGCVLLWRVLLRLAVPGAWLAGLIFAVHPVAVESIAWITERKNTLPLVFYLLSLLLYLRADDEEFPPSRRRLSYAASIAAFLLALLAKTSVVILPLVLLLCAWWRRRRVSVADLRRTAPFFALSAILGLVTAWYQSHRAIGTLVVRDDGFASRLAIAGRAVWFYLAKAVVPVDLAFVYPRWTTGDTSWAAFVPLALLAATFALLWRARRGWGRPLLFALGYFVIGLLPVLGFLDIYFMRYSLVADHWQYTSLIGIAALAAAAVTSARSWAGPFGANLAAAGLIALLGTLSWRQQAPYRDERTLWTDTLAKNPSAWIASNNLGGLLLQDGRAAEAVARFEAALASGPDDVGIRANLGRSLLQLKRFDEAAAQYREVIRLQPDYAEAHNSLGLALQGLGRAADAISEHEAALRLKPDYAEAHNCLGNALYGLGRLEEATTHYQAALRIRPDYPEAHNNLGNAFYGLGQMQDAATQYQEALRIRPEYAEACSNLGSALKKLGRIDEAIVQYQATLRLKPDLVGAVDNLILALQQAGRFKEAVEQYDAVLLVRPDDAAVLSGAAWILSTCPDANVRNGRRSLELAQRAVELTSERGLAPLESLAAAHAELGNFADAVRRQEQAIALTPAASADAARARLEAYRRGLPWRESSTAP